jgi:hypothetical protein
VIPKLVCYLSDKYYLVLRIPQCDSNYVTFVVSIVARRAVSREGLGKHVPSATDTHTIIDVLLEKMFSCSVRIKKL